MTSSPWPALSVIVPLAAALVALGVPHRAVRWVGAAGTLATAVVAGALVHAIATSGTIVEPLGGWLAPLGIGLGGDRLTALMAATTAVVGVATSAFAVVYFDAQDAASSRRGAQFWPLWLLCWAALSALWLARDLFNVYVTLELLTLAAVALVALAGGDALEAALRYLIWALAGSGLYLMAVALVYGQTGTLDFALIGERLVPGAATTIAVAFAFGGLLVKGALFPLHFWLPPAHARAPAPVSAVLSALVVMAAFYLVLRLGSGPFARLGGPHALEALGMLGVGAVAWGSAQALVQTRLKLLVAYSTVAQVGYFYIALALGAPDAAALLAVAHAFAKAALFLCAGLVLHGLGDDRIEALPGLASTQPVTVFAFGLAGMSLIGLPPSGGFLAKWLVLERAIETGAWLYAAALLLGGLAAAGYVFRVLAPCFASSDRAPVQRTPPVPALACLALALVAVALGFAAPLIVEPTLAGAPR